jgi:hypothetical protein
MLVKGYKTYLRRYKSLFERLGWKSGLFVNFDQFPCSWIRTRIRIPNTDPDPGKTNQCGSMRFRIQTHNTAQIFHFTDSPRRLLRSSQPRQIFQPRQEGFYNVQGLISPVAASRKDFSAILTVQSLDTFPDSY